MHHIFLQKFKNFADKNSNYIHKEKKINYWQADRKCDYFYSFVYVSVKIFKKVWLIQ